METSMKTSEKAETNNWSYGKWMMDNTSSMFDLCNRQMKDMMSFYNNFIHSSNGTKSIDSYDSPYSWMKRGINSWNAVLFPFNSMYKSGIIWDEVSANYANMLEKLSEWNKELFGIAYKQLENDETDMEKLRSGWVNLIENQMEHSHRFVNLLNEAFQKRMDFNSQLFKSMLKTINQQSHLMNDQSAKIFEEISKILSTEQPEANKEKVQNQSKVNQPEKKVTVY